MFRTRRLAFWTIGPRLALGLLALCAALPACVTRESRETLVDTNSLQVFLRSQKRGTSEIEKGYDHPRIIAADRLVNILASIEVENIAGRGKQLRRLLARDVIESVADELSKAFKRANENQEVAVMAILKERRRVVLLQNKFLTSFVTYLRDGAMYLYVSRVEWEIPKDSERRQRNERLPEPRIGDNYMKLRLVPAPGMYQEGAHGVSLRWRDNLFAKPVELPKERGRPRPRTILMESPIPREEIERQESRLPADLTPDELRELAELKEARRDGRITEGEYLRRLDELTSE